jgi:hypothetical protein
MVEVPLSGGEAKEQIPSLQMGLGDYPFATCYGNQRRLYNVINGNF